MWYQLTIMSPFYSGAYERYMRAELLRETGRYDEALAWYRTLGESSPFELIYVAPAHLRRAAIHERLGQKNEAAEQLTRAAALWRAMIRSSRRSSVATDERNRNAPRISTDLRVPRSPTDTRAPARHG